MSIYDNLRTNEDYSRVFTALRSSAVEFGVDVNDERIAAWLRHHSECVAEDAARIRYLYNLIHMRGN